MDFHTNFKTIQDTISSALVSVTRTATKISAEDLGFQRSLDPTVANTLDKQNARLLVLAERLLANAASGSEVVGPKLQDADGVEANWRGVVDVVDSLLEKADTSLDEYTGVVKRLSPSEEQVTTKQLPSKLLNELRSKDLPKPQKTFEHVPQNNETGAFRPLITSKPHAMIPLEESLSEATDLNGKPLIHNPYQTEIEFYKYPPSVYTRAEPIPYAPFENTTATFVDTPEALDSMLAELKTAQEIAIDLEHHDNRSYIGLVSLMQISTRNRDWIIDTLKPWRRRLECLNEVFTDPNILKVLHGAFMDIIWLQRDLGLYIVGLFDTYQAARALGYTSGALAFLLQKFVNFQAQKKYQMADWRRRPLTPAMFEYARSDTHFLLYIYDNMRNELIDRSDFSNPETDLTFRVLEKSKETALQRYEHPVYDTEFGLGAGGWYRLLSRTPATFSKEQFSVYRAVHRWRDNVARQEDESTNYVMANHAIFSIARAIPLDKAALLGVAQPISPILRLRADELVAVIKAAKEAGENGPDMNEVLSKIDEIHQKPIFQPQSLSVNSATNILSTPTVATLVALPIRTHTSQFWGPAFTSSIWEQRRTASTANIRLALPLPQLTAEVFADPADANTVVDSSVKGEHAFVSAKERVKEEEDDGIFIIKQLGGGRKRKMDEMAGSVPTPLTTADLVDEDAGADEVPLLDDKARRKAEKKAAKRLKKQQKALNGSATENGNDEASSAGREVEPFDYSTAPSVLHARHEEGKKGKKEKREKGFNPYAKAMDAPKGLGRSQRESAGRSKTFGK